MADGFGKVIRSSFRALLALLGGIVGYQFAQTFVPLISHARLEEWNFWLPSNVLLTGVFVLILAFLGFLLAPLFLRALGFIGSLFERQLQTTSWQDISTATMGLIVGLLVANLIALPFSDIPAGSYIAVFLNIVLGYVGARLFLNRQQDIRGVFGPILGLKEKLTLRKSRHEGEEHSFENDESLSVMPVPRKILDTSVVIDGRILDIAKTGFLQGVIVLPRFVLIELQSVADSTDPARRTRGRRGLDIVNELQKLEGLKIEIMEVSPRELKVDSVDNGLVALAQKIGGEILTTDYNLNKVAQIQDIMVLNVNDLANALKPMLLPGDNIDIDVIREGKEPHQGVGYLDDGTMLVIEDGEDYIGKRVSIVVTSMLQTSAGRMVFGRIRREVRV